MAKMHDQIQSILAGQAPEPPIGRLIGFHIATIAPGQAIIEFEAGPQHANPMGSLHGGVLCDIADAAMGLARASHAWVDVYLSATGWLSLDPTHNLYQTGQYVRVAIGRDYADVPPTRGVFKGQAKETLDVKVSVTGL